jgi:serine/threonine-protein kinase
MGEVRKAHDLRLSRDVAVKFLRPDLAAQPDVRQRFAAEARNASRLTSPNVVLVLDSGEHEGTPYLVMECLPGPTLHDELKNGPVGEECAKTIARDVLGGLIAAHDLGIIHRDISPGNILLAPSGHVKIADFGIAKSAEGMDLTVVGQVLGTPAYLAPERVQGAPATPASDVYALGVVLYEALTGVRPFVGNTPVAVATSVMSTTPEPLSALRPDLDPRLIAAVEGAMAKDPARRIPTAAAMLDVLEGAERTRAIPVTRTVAAAVPTTAAFAPVSAPAARSWADAGRSRRAVWITVAAAVAIGVLLLALTTHKPGADTSTTQSPTTAPVAAPTTTVTAPRVTSAVVVRTPIPAAPKVVVGGGKHGKGGKGGKG